MKVIQDIVTYFDRQKKLSRAELKKLLDTNFVASDAPLNMNGFCEVMGAIYYFRVTGVVEGQVWGTDTYSRDSVLGAAAVHAGLVKPGEMRVLRVTVVPPPKSYQGTTRHGVTTSEYGEYPYAWTLSVI